MMGHPPAFPWRPSAGGWMMELPPAFPWRPSAGPTTMRHASQSLFPLLPGYEAAVGGAAGAAGTMSHSVAVESEAWRLRRPRVRGAMALHYRHAQGPPLWAILGGCGIDSACAMHDS